MTRHHTPQHTFRENPHVWAVFVGTCARNGTNASTVLKNALREYLLENGTSPEELADLLRADVRDLHNEPHPTTHAGTRA